MHLHACLLSCLASAVSIDYAPCPHLMKCFGVKGYAHGCALLSTRLAACGVRLSKWLHLFLLVDHGGKTAQGKRVKVAGH